MELVGGVRYDETDDVVVDDSEAAEGGGRGAQTQGSWKRVGNIFRTEVPNPGNVRYELTDLYPDTYHMVEIRSHNNLGFSAVSSVVILTARGKFMGYSLRCTYHH